MLTTPLFQFPRLLTPTVAQFWDEVCYSAKIVSSSGPVNTALLKKGMWALRALSGHGLGPKEIVTLAKYFSHRAALLFGMLYRIFRILICNEKTAN